MGTFNLHSVFNVVEEDVVGEVKPIFEKLLGEAAAELSKLGREVTHVSSVLTSDAGSQTVTPAAPVVEPAPAPVPVEEPPPPVEEPPPDDTADASTLPTDAPGT